MIDVANFAALDEMLDQLPAKPHDARSQPKMGQLRGLADGCIRISLMQEAVNNL
jgi:hypothetical protein